MSWVIIYLERLSPIVSSNQPEAGGPRHRFYSVLLRMGFTEPSLLPGKRWSLTPPFHPYRTSGSPRICGGLFLLHFPWSHLHRPLTGILPCEARTFLTCGLSALAAAITCLTSVSYHITLSCNFQIIFVLFCLSGNNCCSFWHFCHRPHTPHRMRSSPYRIHSCRGLPAA